MDERSLAALTADEVIDCQGEVCPYPVIMARRALQKLRTGQLLVQITDHSISTETVPEAVRREGLAEVVGILQERPGVYKLYLKKL